MSFVLDNSSSSNRRPRRKAASSNNSNPTPSSTIRPGTASRRQRWCRPGRCEWGRKFRDRNSRPVLSHCCRWHSYLPKTAIHWSVAVSESGSRTIAIAIDKHELSIDYSELNAASSQMGHRYAAACLCTEAFGRGAQICILEAQSAFMGCTEAFGRGAQI